LGEKTVQIRSFRLSKYPLQTDVPEAVPCYSIAGRTGFADAGPIPKATDFTRMEAQMAAVTQTYKPTVARIVFTKKHEAFLERLMPRRCMVISVGMILAGMGVPVLMVFKVLPVTLLLGFVGFALVAVGGVLTLVNCGEL
jgi:hypothetical protein